MSRPTIVKEGWVEKRAETFLGMSFKKRWLVLSEDKTLKYFEDEGKNNLKGIINLGEAISVQKMKTMDSTKAKGQSYFHGIVLVTKEKSWTLFVETEKLLYEWLQAIESVGVTYKKDELVQFGSNAEPTSPMDSAVSISANNSLRSDKSPTNLSDASEVNVTSPITEKKSVIGSQLFSEGRTKTKFQNIWNTIKSTGADWGLVDCMHII
ncbi:hypothetical protein RFI_32251 [Reticulomyxa filosa]|uniref:PH domain-containing protein n=1 Tax=Reticulomyxa filosa TaxID=46433 RepID=X6LWN7_RETFI|nr:hypothetical protein RFI_32251 [Reticulomyxa filosa]|eukprot:ETO05145.1 hypothetical protein RFI_32251 [Reticulomyxa filosa]